MQLSLKGLEKVLDEYEFNHTSLAISETVPYDQIFVYLGEDENEKEWILNLRLFQEEIPDSDPGTKMYFLNFFITFPFQVKQSCFGELSRMILLVNKLLPVPGFGLSEFDGLMYYAYTYPCVNGEFDPEMLLTMIALITHVMTSHVQVFEPVARDLKSMDEVMNEAHEMVKSLQK